MRIIQNPNQKLADRLLREIEENGGYCPCTLVRVPDMKCLCREFREMPEGTCHCGLYIKIQNEGEEYAGRKIPEGEF